MSPFGRGSSGVLLAGIALASLPMGAVAADGAATGSAPEQVAEASAAPVAGGLLAPRTHQAPSPAGATTSALTPSAVLTLQDAFLRALEANRTIAGAREEVAVAGANKRAALSLVLPKLALNGGLTRNSDEVEFGSEDDLRTILPRDDWQGALVLDQPVFAGLREKRAYDQSKLALESAREGVRGAEDGTLLGVAQAYLAAVQAERLIEVEQKNLELAERRRQQAQAFYEAGETTRVDLLRALADIKGFERRLVVARQQRDDAAGRLRVALALEGEVAVVEPETAVPPVPEASVLEQRALAERPEIRQAGLALRTAQLEVSKQKGAYLPVVRAQAGYVKQKRTFPKDEYGYASLLFSVPIFQGGEIGARVASAQGRERQAELALAEVRQQVREEVRVELLGLEAARTALALSQEQLQAAEAEYAQTFELYSGQEATTLDLQASEATLSEARRAVITSRLVARLQETRVWYAAGALKAAVLEVLP